MQAVIGIVTRNRSGILPRALSSALQQHSCSLRVAVVDDESTDATSGVARDFPSVHWTRWDTNRGLVAARNYLMTSASEHFFVSLDDDAWFVRGDEVSMALQVMEANHRVAAVAFDILSLDRPDPVARSGPRPSAVFVGCGHVLRLSAVRAVGAYEPMPGTYGAEEKDLCLRLLDAGYEIVTLPGVHVWHDKTPTARVKADQHSSGVCNDLTMTLRRTPALLLMGALLLKAYKHVAFSRKHGLTRPCLTGFELFLCSLPAVWRTRRPVRTATLRAFIRLSRPTQLAV